MRLRCGVSHFIQLVSNLLDQSCVFTIVFGNYILCCFLHGGSISSRACTASMACTEVIGRCVCLGSTSMQTLFCVVPCHISDISAELCNTVGHSKSGVGKDCIYIRCQRMLLGTLLVLLHEAVFCVNLCILLILLDIGIGISQCFQLLPCVLHQLSAFADSLCLRQWISKLSF